MTSRISFFFVPVNAAVSSFFYQIMLGGDVSFLKGLEKQIYLAG